MTISGRNSPSSSSQAKGSESATIPAKVAPADVDDVATTANQWPETLRSGLSHRQSLEAVHEVAVDVVGLAIRHEINIAREQVLEHDLDLKSGK